jgi:flagellar biosynthesis GTPase FlhF
LFLQSGAVKKDKETAKIIKKATSSFSDEAQDFRYGPPALEMLVKFVNKFSESNEYKRLDTRVFTILAYDKERAMIEAKESKGEWKQFLQKRADVVRTDDQFLEIMKSLFSTFDLQGSEFVLNEERFNDSFAKSEIQKIITYIVDDIEEYKREIEEWEREQRERQEEESWKAKYKEETESEEESDIDRLVRQSLSNEEPEPVQQKSYDEMTIAEIQQVINDAVADENYELAAELTNKYLKGESKKVWENELKRINENLHTRRKR